MNRTSWLLLGLLLATLAAGLWAVNRLGGWRYTAHRLYTNEAWPTYTQRLSQLDMLPIESGAIVLIGDSYISQGLWHELLPGLRIYNRGIPGEGIAGLVAYSKQLNLREAAAIIVQIGTNDLLFQPAGEIIEAYTGLVEKVLLPTQAPVILCTLPGVNNEVRWTGIQESDVVLLNQALKELASRHASLHVLELDELLGSEGGRLAADLTDDGVHLRGPGYWRWAEAIEQRLATR